MIQLFDSRLPDRFWSRVIPEPNSGCWLWLGQRDKDDYGAISVGARSTHRAHRFAYSCVHGVIEQGLDLDHLCRVTACVNPAHLEPVTGIVNILRGTSFAAKNAAKTQCVNGHPFTPENTYEINGGRRCRECERARARVRSYGIFVERRASGVCIRCGGPRDNETLQCDDCRDLKNGARRAARRRAS